MFVYCTIASSPTNDGIAHARSYDYGAAVGANESDGCKLVGRNQTEGADEIEGRFDGANESVGA